MGNSQGIG